MQGIETEPMVYEKYLQKDNSECLEYFKQLNKSGEQTVKERSERDYTGDPQGQSNLRREDSSGPAAAIRSHQFEVAQVGVHNEMLRHIQFGLRI